MKKILEQIAAKYLGVKSLETRNNDHLDFHNCSVWGLVDALTAAYNAGKDSASVEEYSALLEQGRKLQDAYSKRVDHFKNGGGND